MLEIENLFTDNVFNPIARKCLAELNLYIHQNRTEIVNSFIRSMDCLNSKLVDMDLIDTRYIDFALLRTKVAKEREFLYSVHLFDAKLKKSTISDIGIYYNAYWLTEHFKNFCLQLDVHIKQSMIKSYPLLIRELNKKLIDILNSYFVHMAKISLREYSLFSDINYNKLSILAGDYISPNCRLSDINVDFVKDYSHTWSRNIEQTSNIGKITVANIIECDFTIIERLNDISIVFSNLLGCNFSHALVQYGDFTGSIFNNCNFQGATFMNCNMKGVVFKNSNLSQSVFYQCIADCFFNETESIYNAIEFSSSNLSRAKFKNSQFAGASFINCILDDTVFEKTNVDRVAL